MAAQSCVNAERVNISYAMITRQRAGVCQACIQASPCCSMLVSSHVLSDLEAVCDHVVFIERARLAARYRCLRTSSVCAGMCQCACAGVADVTLIDQTR